MAATSFQFRYPLNRNPYVADEAAEVIYPYSRWGDFATSSNLYVYGRQVPQRSFFGHDLNLSARPITRLVQPSVLEYVPLDRVSPISLDPASGGVSYCSGDVKTVAPIVASPILNNRFAALGAQVASNSVSSTMVPIMLILLLAVGGFFLYKRKTAEK